MWLLKIFGMFMIFLACSIGGILKARLIAVRTEVLRKTARSLSDLAERIRLSGGEIAELLNLCFKDIKIASLTNLSTIVGKRQLVGASKFYS
jgi:hypothetical protein